MRPSGHTSVMSSRVEAADSLDDFPSPPWSARAGGELIRRIDPAATSCWEPACGRGTMAFGLADYFDDLFATDIHDYGFGGVLDFLGEEAAAPQYSGRYDFIVSNPPFRLAEQFVRMGLRRAKRGVAMLCRSVFLEGAGRNPLFTDPDLGFAIAAQFAERVPMVKGRWDPQASTATAYSWFVWFRPNPDLGLTEDAIFQAQTAGGHLGLIIPPGTRARLSRPADLARFCRGVGDELFGGGQ